MVGVKNVVWEADAFLVMTPDAVLGRILPPVGFGWGYRIEAEAVLLVPVEIAGATDWELLDGLRDRFRSWTFEDWPR